MSVLNRPSQLNCVFGLLVKLLASVVHYHIEQVYAKHRHIARPHIVSGIVYAISSPIATEYDVNGKLCFNFSHHLILQYW